MKKKPVQQRHVSKKEAASLKRRLTAALSMLLVGVMMLGYSTYAWLTLSVAPEVSGIQTNIGANGSLEIALLNSETRLDLSQIKSTIGESLENNDVSANNNWGNLISLEDSSYGLNDIILLPARMNMTSNDAGYYTIDSQILSVPTYGFDGRITKLTNNTVNGIYKGSNFVSSPETPSFGVRAIGTAESLSTQSSSLGQAKTIIATSSNTAKSNAISAIQSYDEGLFNIIIKKSTNSAFDNSDVETLKNMLSALDNSATAIDSALRHGLIAFAASKIEDEALFATVKSEISNPGKLLSDIVQHQSDIAAIELPQEFVQWIAKSEAIKNSIKSSQNACEALTDDDHTWDEIKNILNSLMNLEAVLLGTDESDTKPFSEWTSGEITSLIGKKGVQMSLSYGSGIFVEIAEFTGNYSAVMQNAGMEIQVRTLISNDLNYLGALSAAVAVLESASGNAVNKDVTITTTYGYAIDLAFRCNAPLSDLLLQTSSTQRIYSDSSSSSTMGGGSYMEFTIDEENLGVEQTTKLMDAIRVVFVDDQNNVLGLAKLNVSNRTISETSITAPLYLYEFSLSENEENSGALIMGERRKIDNKIVSLGQNIAKAITAIVYLDGDIVDNTMVSATKETSISGMLNLQFASSADLIPAGNSDLMNASPDKAKLAVQLADSQTTYEAGQGMYTTVSWNKFVEAYNYALSINSNDIANDLQVYRASKLLIESKQGLSEQTLDTLKSEIDRIRDFMGQTTDIARYVLEDVENEKYYAIETYTQEQLDSKVGDILRVDYSNNLKDEGNDIFTPIYTDASWSALASTLYDAEVLYYHNQYTDFIDIDQAITKIKVAEDTLQRRVFYTPYEMNGELYYFAISEETDTYGKWYYCNFKRVVSDITILELDAYAKQTDIAKIVHDDYVKNGSQIMIPLVDINDDLYYSLKDEEFWAIKWETSNQLIQLMTNSQKAHLENLVTRANNVGVDATAANELLSKDNPGNGSLGNENISSGYVTYTEAATVISNLEAQIIAKEAAGQTGDTTTNLETQLPIGSEVFELVYGIDYTHNLLMPTSETGEVTLKVTILTRSGIINTISKTFTIYAAAEKAEIQADSAELEVGASTEINCVLKQAEKADGSTYSHGEEIDYCRWSTSDINILKVNSSTSSSNITLTAVASGSAKVTVSVYTIQGNVYTSEYEFTITEAPQSPTP